MKIKSRTGLRWNLLLGYLVVAMLLLACMALTGGSTEQDNEVDNGLLRLEDGAVKAQDQNGSWKPVAGDSTFEWIGHVDSTDPWTVEGRTFATNGSTRVEQGVGTGDLVRVQGAVSEGENWLAYSIEPEQEQTDPIAILIGRVTSVDPWVVNGITLNRTDETLVEGEVAPGMLVRVEILLLEDGTWEVVSIAPLGIPADSSGCTTVIATVESVDGNQIRFLGWPVAVALEENLQTENDNEGENEEAELAIRPGQKVMVVVCVAEDGDLVIRDLTVLDADDGEEAENGEKVLVCHKPSKNAHTLSISSSAVPAHLGHGDTMGPCP